MVEREKERERERERDRDGERRQVDTECDDKGARCTLDTKTALSDARGSLKGAKWPVDKADVNEAACYHAARNADTSICYDCYDYYDDDCSCLPILSDRSSKTSARERLRSALSRTALYVSTSAVLPRSSKRVAVAECPL